MIRSFWDFSFSFPFSFTLCLNSWSRFLGIFVLDLGVGGVCGVVWLGAGFVLFLHLLGHWLFRSF